MHRYRGSSRIIDIGSWLGFVNGAHSLSKCLRGDDVVLVLRYHKYSIVLFTTSSTGSEDLLYPDLTPFSVSCMLPEYLRFVATQIVSEIER